MRNIRIAVWVLLVIALVGLGLPAGVQAQGDDDGLVAEWHFDEGSGSVLADSSGNGNDGAIHGATWVEGKYGKALSFDGVDDYVGVPDSTLWNFGTGDFTVSFWFTKLDTARGHTLSFGSMGHGNNLNFDFDDRDSGGKGVWVYWMGGGGIPRVWTTTTYHDSNWHHLSFIRMGNVFKLYIDNNCIDQTTDSSDIQIIGNLCIGRNNYNGGQNYFNGIIDEVRIYNRALTADEIKSHYEGQQTALSLTKSAAPHSIKQGQTTTVTLTVTNTGTTEITDIEVSDTILSDLTFVSGETSKTYTSLRPKDSREFQYIIQLNEAGTFNLYPATATYADEEGNYHTTESETAAITVIPSTDQPTTTRTAQKSSTEISTACVHLHGEKTDVVMGEDILLKLSAVNKITKPTMTLQVILIPPSGMSVTSADFVKSGAGLYTSTYVIEPGIGRDIEVGIRSNQVGDFVVNGEVIYYFGDDKENAEEHLLSLPITVREGSSPQQETPVPTATPKDEKGVPGFEAVLAAAGMLLVALLIKRRR